jgi:hypothetical protein
LKEGQKAIVLVFDEPENKENVIQPAIKRNVESDFSARLAVLEEEIRELRTLIEKEAHFYANIQKTDGPGAIRTPDLRRVKTEALGVLKHFPQAISL